jgi:hypothetical protein
MNTDLRQDQFFLGRTSELFQLVRNLQRGRHTLIVGPKGIGKTRLMLEARDILLGKTKRIEFAPGVISRLKRQLWKRPDPKQYQILVVYHSSPLGDCLKELCRGLLENGDLRLDPNVVQTGDWPVVKKMLTGLGLVGQQQVVIQSLSAAHRPYLVFIDSLDRITPTHHAFIEQLLTHSVVCAAVVQMKEAFHFKKIWSSFSRIDLEPLDDQTSAQLIRHYLDGYSIRVIDRELYTREILKAANGNPFQIQTMLWHGSRERRVDAEEMRKLRRVDEGDYFNMGPVYIFGASIFTLFKIFSLGTDNREFYIYFSALGFLVYLAFRVFRSFFLFRPQKYSR